MLPGSRSAGLCNSTAALPSPWSLFRNQAGIAGQKDIWIGIHHGNKFFIKELGQSAIGLCIPVKPGTLGVTLVHFGFKQFHQTKTGLNYGMMLSENLAIGIGLNFHFVQFLKQYGKTKCISAEGGITYHPLKELIVGAFLVNPTGSYLTSPNDMVSSFGIGLAYIPNDNLIITLQGEDSNQSTPVFRCGIEYNPRGKTSIRTGIASNPKIMAFGLGWEYDRFVFDLSFSYHQFLGYTPELSVAYTFENRVIK